MPLDKQTSKSLRHREARSEFLHHDISMSTHTTCRFKVWVPYIQLIDGINTSVKVEKNSPIACSVTKQRWCQLHTQMKTNVTRTSAIITFWVYQTITLTRITMTGCRTSTEGQVIHDLLQWWISRYSTTVEDMKPIIIIQITKNTTQERYL
jgi:hypothetical protein